jgi:hypothetical protein
MPCIEFRNLGFCVLETSYLVGTCTLRKLVGTLRILVDRLRIRVDPQRTLVGTLRPLVVAFRILVDTLRPLVFSFCHQKIVSTANNLKTLILYLEKYISDDLRFARPYSAP